MFSVITNIYNKKTKGPTLMELFTATGKLKKFFLTTRDVRCVRHGWHSAHRYNIQVVATHASTCWRVCGGMYAENATLKLTDTVFKSVDQKMPFGGTVCALRVCKYMAR